MIYRWNHFRVNLRNDKALALSHIKRDEATELLSIWLVPNGDNKIFLSILKVAAAKWTGRVYKRKSSRQEAWTALHTKFLLNTSICY